MELKYFSAWNGSLPLLIEARIILVAHLIADTLTLGGEPALALNIHKRKLKLTPAEKINFVYSLTLAEEAEDWEKEVKEHIEVYYEEIKSASNNIATNKSKFIMIKKLESTLTEFFDSFIEEYEEEVDLTVMPKLRKTIEVFPINSKMPSLSRLMVTNKPPKPSKVAKEILDFMYNNQTKGNLTSLPVFDNFFMMPVLNNLNKEGTDITPKDLTTFEIPQTIEDYYKIYENTPNFQEDWLNISATIPFINELNEWEMLMLKKDMQQPLIAFNAAADEWVACRKKTHPNKEALALTHVDLMEAGKSLTSAFKNHPLCLPKANNETINASYYQLIFFKVKVEEVWNYYEGLEILPAEIIAEIHNLTQQNTTYPKYLPVLGINIQNDILLDMFRQSQLLPTTGSTKKKSIDFD